MGNRYHCDTDSSPIREWERMRNASALQNAHCLIKEWLRYSARQWYYQFMPNPIDQTYLPAQMRDRLHDYLPDRPHIIVRSLDARHKRCPAWQASHYEVAAFYYSTKGNQLAELEAALAALPGVCLTTIIDGHGQIDIAWPVRHQSPSTLRAQVLALVAMRPTCEHLT